MGKLVVEGVDLTKFLGIPYVGSRHPGNVSIEEFLAHPELGANCQLFTLGVLARAGFSIDYKLPMDRGERLGSKELWMDDTRTRKVAVIEGEWTLANEISLCREASRTFNLFFFWPKGVYPQNLPSDFKKLHVGICVGSLTATHSHDVLHNAKPGPSSVWRLGDFFRSGYRPYGIKRHTYRKTG